MNSFFAGFNNDEFTYDPKKQEELEFIRLREIREWEPTSKAYKKVRKQFLKALVKETKSPVHAFFVDGFTDFDYNSGASPKLEFQRLARFRKWKEKNPPYKRAKLRFEEAFNQEFGSDLDKFFEGFAGFDYNPRNESKKEFVRLAKRWGKKSQDYQNAKKKFFTAFAKEFDSYFGTDEQDIVTWETLCKALGADFEPVPTSIKKCRQRLETLHVNIYDLIYHMRTKAPFDFFDTQQELSEYTCDNDLVFPKKRAKSGPLKFIMRSIRNPKNHYGRPH